MNQLSGISCQQIRPLPCCQPVSGAVIDSHIDAVSAKDYNSVPVCPQITIFQPVHHGINPCSLHTTTIKCSSFIRKIVLAMAAQADDL